MLALTGFWHEDFISEQLHTKESLETYISDIHTEYVTERDKHELGGQSPHDNDSSGQKILAALRKHLEELEYKPSFSFIYRLLGGLRGPDDAIYKISDFLTLYDKLCVEMGFIKPNGFFFAGKKY